MNNLPTTSPSVAQPLAQPVAPPVGQRAPRAAARASTMATALLAALWLAGCASPGGIAPSARLMSPAAAGWSSGSQEPAAGTSDPLFGDRWWEALGDPVLDRLIDRGLSDHPSLRLAAARLSAAQAASAGAEAGRGPRVDGSAEATRQHFTENGLYPPPIGGSDRTIATVQATAHWEVDFFGRHRAAIASAVGAQRAAQADAAASRLLLASRIAQGYVELAHLVELRELSERTLSQRQSLLDLTRQRVGAGLDTNVELRQGEGSIPEVRSQIEAIDGRIALARHALAALTAQPPAALDTLAPRLADARTMAPPATLPVDLVGRRPEITAARWRVEAALQDVALARTDFYPNLDLSAFIGLNSFGLDRLFEAGSRNFGIGPALRLPIFDSGRLRAQLRGRSAQADAAVESYNEALLQAVHDVADQLSTLRSIERQQVLQAEALAATESAYDLAVQRYKAGLGSYLVVLSAEGSVLAQRRAGADLKATALETQFALARALGGGYRAPALPDAGIDAAAATGREATPGAMAVSPDPSNPIRDARGQSMLSRATPVSGAQDHDPS